MNALVTGASGFIGRWLVEKLRAQNHCVRAYVRRTSRVDFLKALEVELCLGDLANAEALRQAARGVDVVFHLAARVGVWGRALEYDEANAIGTRNVLQALVDGGVPRLVHFSSVAVYGKQTGLLSEDLPPQRIGDPHGDSKIDAEELVLESARRNGFAFTILRPSLVYGPYDSRYIPAVTTNLLRGRMRVVGSGRNVAPLVYVEDVAECALRAAERDAAVGEIFNVSSGEPVTWKEFLTTFAEYVGTRLPRLHLPAIPMYAAACVLEVLWKLGGAKNPPPATRFGTRLLASDWRYDITKARQILDFEPKIHYKEGLKRTLAWMEREQSYRRPA